MKNEDVRCEENLFVFLLKQRNVKWILTKCITRDGNVWRDERCYLRLLVEKEQEANDAEEHVVSEQDQDRAPLGQPV